jgi:hypothetical protein
MTELVACLSTGKGTWGHVSRLLEGMDGQPWEKIFLLTNDYGKQNFKTEGKPIELIEIHDTLGLEELRDEIREKLKDKIKGMEVAVNFVSGSGWEHLALMSALIQLGVACRFVGVTKDGVKEL